jgi:hypothetical protein
MNGEEHKVSDNTDKNYPATAITTWSGFVYQGKIALYHCLKMINQGDVDFELQLDSSDDFAIYKSGVLTSAHQVKAKITTAGTPKPWKNRQLSSLIEPREFRVTFMYPFS